jgi:hypothetical protein
MKFDDWVPNTGDPALNVVLIVILVMLGITVLAMGAVVAVPVIAVVAIAKGIHWYANRPVPTDRLYAETEQRAIASRFPSLEEFGNAYVDRFTDAVQGREPVFPIAEQMLRMVGELYKDEGFNNPLPPMPFADAIEEGRYRDRMIAHQKKTADAPRTLEIFNDTIARAFTAYLSALPEAAIDRTDKPYADRPDRPVLTVPLIDLFADPKAIMWEVLAPFYRDEVTELDLFADFRRHKDKNFRRAAELTNPRSPEKLVAPDEFKGTPHEALAVYFCDTHLARLFHAPAPIAFADETRFEHTHVVAGSGHGKTQFLQHLILSDLTRPDPPALVIIDSQGEMLEKLRCLELFAPGQPLADRLIVVDPEDVEFPPALNMFAQASARQQNYSAKLREQVEAAILENFNYVFGALAAELTSRQNTTFAFVAKLMLSIDGATIHTLRQLFEDGALRIDDSPFAEAIARLDDTTQSWFRHQFFTKSYAPTRQQIARRLYSVLQVPAFDRMFAAKENRLDLFEALQAGKIVLVNTSKAMLKTDASALFGRAMIARVVAAAFERVALSPAERRPAFLIVDEAAEYFDDNIEALLSQARKYKLGVVLAHQHLDQLTPGLRAAVAANTAIKLAGGVSDKDARALAPDMRCDASFIAGMSKHQHASEFACFVRNYTNVAVRLTVPFGALESAPRMSDDDQARLVAANRDKIAVRRDSARPGATTRARKRKSEPPAEKSDDWRS